MRPSRIVLLVLTAALLGGLIGATATWFALGRWEVARVVVFGTATPTFTLPPPTATPSSTPTTTPTSSPTVTATPTATPSPTPTATSSPTVAMIGSLPELIERVSPAVVTIINSPAKRPNAAGGEEQIIWGSGVIIHPQGFILTNAHVARDAEEMIVIRNNGRDALARLVAIDTEADLALLKLQRGTGYPALPWGDSEALRLGDIVLVIGSPLGNLPNSVTTGIVSGLNRTIKLEGDVEMSGLIQTDAAVNRGNSGGPLLNASGEVVGIITLVIRDDVRGTQPTIQGIGFAIPSATARPLVEKWIAENK